MTNPTLPLDDTADLFARLEAAEAAVARVAELVFDMRTWRLGADPLRYADAVAEALLPPGVYLPGAAINALEELRRGQR